MDKETFLNKIRPEPFLVTKEYDFQKRYESLLEIALTICPDFEIFAEEKKIYENAIRYFSGDPSGEFNIKKGLYLYGPIGNGKSLFFKIFSALNAGSYSGNDFRTLTISNLIDGVARDGFKFFSSAGITTNNGFISMARNNTLWIRHILIDDIGQSISAIKYFGSEVNVVIDFFQRRYDEFSNNSALTHVATNVKPGEIKKEYGEFISSRMKEMFNVILFPGEDKRK
jgi:hypothetical protein